MTKTLLLAASAGALMLGSANAGTVTITQVAKLTASDGAAFDLFGGSVALDGGTVVIGAEGDDDNGAASGSAYLFDTSGNQLQKLTASDGAPVDAFGSAVALDSGKALIGAPFDDDKGSDSGSAYLFDTSGNQLQKLTASDGTSGDLFGWSVALDGGEALIGARFGDGTSPNSGSAYLFDTSGNQLEKLTASDGAGSDLFGSAVALDGGIALIGAPFDDDSGSASGSAYLFDASGNQLQKITASDGASPDRFGWSVALDSGNALIGAYTDDNNGANSGSAYLFDTSGNQLQKLTASDGTSGDAFGWSVALSDRYVAIGARADDDNGTNSGSVYVFDLITGDLIQKLTASDGQTGDLFGSSVAIFADLILVGAPRGDGAVADTGAAYLFRINEASPIPVPAAAPLMLAGLGAFGLRRRAKR